MGPAKPPLLMPDGEPAPAFMQWYGGGDVPQYGGGDNLRGNMTADTAYDNRRDEQAAAQEAREQAAEAAAAKAAAEAKAEQQRQEAADRERKAQEAIAHKKQTTAYALNRRNEVNTWNENKVYGAPRSLPNQLITGNWGGRHIDYPGIDAVPETMQSYVPKSQWAARPGGTSQHQDTLNKYGPVGNLHPADPRRKPRY